MWKCTRSPTQTIIGVVLQTCLTVPESLSLPSQCVEISRVMHSLMNCTWPIHPKSIYQSVLWQIDRQTRQAQGHCTYRTSIASHSKMDFYLLQKLEVWKTGKQRNRQENKNDNSSAKIKSHSNAPLLLVKCPLILCSCQGHWNLSVRPLLCILSILSTKYKIKQSCKWEKVDRFPLKMHQKSFGRAVPRPSSSALALHWQIYHWAMPQFCPTSLDQMGDLRS